MRFANSILRSRSGATFPASCPDASCLRKSPIAGIARGHLEIECAVAACAAAKNIGTLSAGVARTAAEHVGAAAHQAARLNKLITFTVCLPLDASSEQTGSSAWH
jgi:hypothetical protein